MGNDEMAERPGSGGSAGGPRRRPAPEGRGGARNAHEQLEAPEPELTQASEMPEPPKVTAIFVSEPRARSLVAVIERDEFGRVVRRRCESVAAATHWDADLWRPI